MREVDRLFERDLDSFASPVGFEIFPSRRGRHISKRRRRKRYGFVQNSELAQSGKMPSELIFIYKLYVVQGACIVSESLG